MTRSIKDVEDQVERLRHDLLALRILVLTLIRLLPAHSQVLLIEEVDKIVPPWPDNITPLNDHTARNRIAMDDLRRKLADIQHDSSPPEPEETGL